MSRGSAQPSIKLASSPRAPARSFGVLQEKCPRGTGCGGKQTVSPPLGSGRALLQDFLVHASLAFWSPGTPCRTRAESREAWYARVPRVRSDLPLSPCAPLKRLLLKCIDNPPPRAAASFLTPSFFRLALPPRFTLPLAYTFCKADTARPHPQPFACSSQATAPPRSGQVLSASTTSTRMQIQDCAPKVPRPQGLSEGPNVLFKHPYPPCYSALKPQELLGLCTPRARDRVTNPTRLCSGRGVSANPLHLHPRHTRHKPAPTSPPRPRRRRREPESQPIWDRPFGQ